MNFLRGLCYFPLLLLIAGPVLKAQELTWAVGGDPRSFDPAKVEDDTEETLRYLTNAVLIRMNRQTQALEPELAERWNVSQDGKTIVFTLRHNLHFSDGTPLTSSDVSWSLHHILSPKTESPLADEFVAPTKVVVETPDPFTVRVRLPARLVTFGSLFDEIAIQPKENTSNGHVTAGLYRIDAYQRGQSIHLLRNERYWKHDIAGLSLPGIVGIRLEVMPNREEEVARFRRGQLSLIDGLPAEYMALINGRSGTRARDLGPSLDTEQMWFNQSPKAPIPDVEKTWFQNKEFRIAISQAIHRSDLTRIAFAGHATVADGFISPSNVTWHNAQLQAPREDKNAALERLHAAGFVTKQGLLYDRSGKSVTFSLLTNAGNRARERMASLIQQDLSEIGIHINIITLDFPALVERLMHTQDYEACLLGVVNVQPDPATGANVWLSSSEDHQWNPSESRPATPWEAEIDSLIHQQASTADFLQRKRSWDRIQQIVADQQPFIYLVHRNVVIAASPMIQGISPTPLRPQLLWNIDRWTLSGKSQ